MLKKIVIMAFVLFSFQASAQSLDTQYSEDGLEVHVLKATVQHNVITIVFAFENTTDQDITSFSLPISGVAFNTQDQNYPVLKDTSKKWLASSVADTNTKTDIFIDKPQTAKHYTFTIKAGKKKIVWAKFEAPQDKDWPLSLTLPNVTPFTIEKPQ